MNYHYEIMNFEIKEITIGSDNIYFTWSYKSLSGSDEFLLRDSKNVITSFKRTKEWILNNHPELLL